MNFSAPIHLISDPLDEETLEQRRVLASVINDEVVNTLLFGIDEADEAWDAPWRLYGLGIDLQDGIASDTENAHVQFTWTKFDLAGSGHPIDAWCGYFAPKSAIGLTFISDIQGAEDKNAPASERMAMLVMADGKMEAVSRDRHGAVSALPEPFEGRLVDAMLTLLCAPVPLRVDPREIALSLLIQAARLYPDPSGYLPLALSDPVALAWLPQDDGETVEHWSTGEVLDEIDAYNALGEEIERRLAAGEPDYLPNELIDLYTPEIAARSLVDNMAFRVSFRSKPELLNWLGSNALMNVFAWNSKPQRALINDALNNLKDPENLAALTRHRLQRWAATKA